GSHGVSRAVEGGNTYCNALVRRFNGGAIRHSLWTRGRRRAPCGLRDGGFGLRGDIEPQPAAVFEVFQRQLKLVVPGLNQVVSHGNALAILLGAVDGDICLAINIQRQDNRVQLRPAAPVRRWESVEVSLE